MAPFYEMKPFVLADAIFDAIQTRELRLQNDTDGMRRSLSQNQINLPSQDLVTI
jgi:hypothetical protein